MEESQEKEFSFMKLEDGLPVYYTDERLFSNDHRIMMVNDIYKMNGINTELILGRNQAKYYHFLEKNKGKAFTVSAFIDKFFKDDIIGAVVDENLVDEDLKRMVREGMIKGVYVKGHYYYHL